MILRDRDMTNGWSGAGDGVLGERYFHLQNWRADVVGMVNAATGVPVERASYSAYGVPRRIALAEYNDDGVLDAFDYDDFTSDFAANQAQNPPPQLPPYDRRLDVNADGAVDAFDYDDFIDDWWTSQGDTGRGVLSRDDIGNRKGYAGYEFENALAGAMEEGDPSDPNALYHVRHRVYDAQRGSWTRRDPLGYVDGTSLYEYGQSMPYTGADAMGLRWEPCPAGQCHGDDPLQLFPPTPEIDFSDPLSRPVRDFRVVFPPPCLPSQAKPTTACKSTFWWSHSTFMSELFQNVSGTRCGGQICDIGKLIDYCVTQYVCPNGHIIQSETAKSISMRDWKQCYGVIGQRINGRCCVGIGGLRQACDGDTWSAIPGGSDHEGKPKRAPGVFDPIPWPFDMSPPNYTLPRDLGTFPLDPNRYSPKAPPGMEGQNDPIRVPPKGLGPPSGGPKGSDGNRRGGRGPSRPYRGR